MNTPIKIETIDFLVEDLEKLHNGLSIVLNCIPFEEYELKGYVKNLDIVLINFISLLPKIETIDNELYQNIKGAIIESTNLVEVAKSKAVEEALEDYDKKVIIAAKNNDQALAKELHNNVYNLFCDLINEKLSQQKLS